MIIFSLVYNGFKRPLTKDDFWNVEESDSSNECTKRLAYEWDKAIKEYNSKNFKNIDATTNFVRVFKNLFHFYTFFSFKLPKNNIKVTKPSLGLCICKAFYAKFLGSSFLKLGSDCLTFLGPIFLE